MPVATDVLPPNAPAPSKVPPLKDSTIGNSHATNDDDDWSYGLKSKWPVALDLAGSNLPCRLEGEVEDLVSSSRWLNKKTHHPIADSVCITSDRAGRDPQRD